MGYLADLSLFVYLFLRRKVVLAKKHRKTLLYLKGLVGDPERRPSVRPPLNDSVGE